MLSPQVVALKGTTHVKIREVQELRETDMDATLRLLSEAPLQSVHLRSMLIDNGLSHPSNRGHFYGYFEDHRIVGLALLGQATMIYARPVAEAAALAHFAQVVIENNLACSFVFGPTSQVEAFWEHLSVGGRKTKLVRDFRWYVCQQTILPLEHLQLLRANHEDLEVIAAAQAQMVKEGTGTDPRQADPAGFKRRVAERIERQRTWIKLENGEVVFKTELQCVTPEVVYLEGVWTREEQRQRGLAKSCLSELVHRLLKQQLMVTLVVEKEEAAAIKLYEQVGFVHTNDYQARYLEQLS